MPCNIGFRSYAKIAIPEPQPQVFKAKADAPNIDEELLDKLGAQDPEFLAWAQTLDTKPLLNEALKRALAKAPAGGIDFTVTDKGVLEAQGSYTNATQRKRLTDAASEISERWQFEVLGIVAQLLNYRVTITNRAGEFVLEGEDEKGTHPCNSLKITKKGADAAFTFEHFKSRDTLQTETAKFLTLAWRLGVKIALQSNAVVEGDPFPGEVRHQHGHQHGHSHTHEHGGKHV